MYTWKYYELDFPVLFSVTRMRSVIDWSMNPGGARLLTFSLLCGIYFIEDIKKYFQYLYQASTALVYFWLDVCTPIVLMSVFI